MNEKQRSWAWAAKSICAVFLVLWILAFFSGDILPKWLTMTLGVLMFVTAITPMLVVAFGPARLLARFPATIRPLAQGHSVTLVIWLAGFGFLFVVRGTLQYGWPRLCSPSFLSVELFPEF
jgi:hypothetical protein